MMGNEVVFSYPPKRIVSLVPSQTELLADLGLEKEVLGITRFCIHPESWFKNKVKVGGTKKFNFKRIRELHPDLIIGNKEENYKEGIQVLQNEYPVLMTDIYTLDDALNSINLLGKATGKAEAAKLMSLEIKENFKVCMSKDEAGGHPKVLYLIWQNPYMGAGVNTFIDEMITAAGYENILKNRSRYPVLSYEEIKEMNPDYIFLSSEPYPFKEKHLRTFADIFPGIKFFLVDGEMFSWYGSRLLKAPAYFNSLLQMTKGY